MRERGCGVQLDRGLLLLIPPPTLDVDENRYHSVENDFKCTYNGHVFDIDYHLI